MSVDYDILAICGWGSERMEDIAGKEITKEQALEIVKDSSLFEVKNFDWECDSPAEIVREVASEAELLFRSDSYTDYSDLYFGCKCKFHDYYGSTPEEAKEIISDAARKAEWEYEAFFGYKPTMPPRFYVVVQRW